MLASKMAYFYIDHLNKDHKLDWGYIKKSTPLKRTKYLDIYYSTSPYTVKIDGKNGIGIIKKPV